MKKAKEMKSEHWDIIAKNLANEELSVEEKREFDQLSDDEEMKLISHQSAEVFDKTTLFFKLKQYNTGKAWAKVNGQLNQKRKNVIHISLAYKVAAIFLLLLTTSIAIWRLGINDQNICEFTTAQFDFSNHEIELPDGSRVKLNYGSKLTSLKEFKGETREVTLTGEAFFNVAPNPAKPFIIKTNNASIKVLGTSFNVYAYSESATVEVFVKTGKVELFDQVSPGKKLGEKILLLPGEKGTINKLKGTIAKETTINPNYLSWYTHEIEFKYTPLEDVFQTLQRAYNLQITVEPGVDLNKELNATFSQQQPDYIMEVVALTQNLKLEKVKINQYIIKNKK